MEIGKRKKTKDGTSDGTTYVEILNNSLNAVEREPVPIRVLNSNASETSYKPKQRSYRKANLKKKFWRPIVPAPKCPVPK